MRILQAQVALHLWSPSSSPDDDNDSEQDKGQDPLRARDRTATVTVAPRQVADTISFFYLHRRLLLSSSSSSSSSSSASSSSSSSSLRFLQLAPALWRALDTTASSTSSPGFRAVEETIAVVAVAVAAPERVKNKDQDKAQDKVQIKGQIKGQDQDQDSLFTLRLTVEDVALDVLGYEGYCAQEQDHGNGQETIRSSLSKPSSSLCRPIRPSHHRVMVPEYLAVLRGLVGMFTDDMGQYEEQGQGQGQGQGEEKKKEEADQRKVKVEPQQADGQGQGLAPVSDLALALGLSNRPHAPVGQFLTTTPTQGLGQTQPTGSGSSGRVLITHTPSISPALRTAVRTRTETFVLTNTQTNTRNIK